LFWEQTIYHSQKRNLFPGWEPPEKFLAHRIDPYDRCRNRIYTLSIESNSLSAQWVEPTMSFPLLQYTRQRGLGLESVKPRLLFLKGLVFPCARHRLGRNRQRDLLAEFHQSDPSQLKRVNPGYCCYSHLTLLLLQYCPRLRWECRLTSYLRLPFGRSWIGLRNDCGQCFFLGD